MKSPQEAIQNLYNDLRLLESGEWVPDADSVDCSLDNAVAAADGLGISQDELEAGYEKFRS